jgi:SNF2 family DNA or RNA helicase
MDQKIISAFKLGTSRLQGRLINPYQRDGVLWLLNRELSQRRKGGFLCDEMGLGKTIQLITMMISNPKPRTLVIVPVSVLSQWESEIKKFAPHLRVYVHHGNNREMDTDNIPQFDVFLTTYSLMRLSEMEQIVPFRYLWDRVILDEGHEIRSNKSKTNKNINHLTTEIKWIVTGTPVFNNVKDFVTLCGWLGIHKQDVQANIKSIRSRYVLRRTKEDVAGFNKRLELPPCEVKNVELDLNPEEAVLYNTIYTECKNKVHEIIRSGIHNGMKAMLILECFLRVRQTLTHPFVYMAGTEDPQPWEHGCAKTDYLVNSIVEHKTEHSIVFCQFITEMNIIQEKLREQNIECFRIDGSVSQEARVHQINLFRKKPSVLVIQIKAGGVGLNLQEATRVYITSPAWNPATELQAIGRAHRTGQTRKVTVERLYYKGTDEIPSIEESIMQLQEHKSAVTSEVLNDPRILAKYPKQTKNTMNIKTLSKIFSS